jgi:hypothetical protein
VGEVPTCQNVRRTAQRAKERLRNDARRSTRERERTGSSKKKSVLRRTVERRHGEPRANLNQRSTQVRARGAALARQTLARSLILYPPRVRDRALDVPVLAQQLGRRLRPDALDAWNDVGVELKGVRSGVERPSSRCVGIESEGPWAERKSLRIGVHRANAVVWGPV